LLALSDLGARFGHVGLDGLCRFPKSTSQISEVMCTGAWQLISLGQDLYVKDESRNPPGAKGPALAAHRERGRCLSRRARA
jgi:hypothetical protein